MKRSFAFLLASLMLLSLLTACGRKENQQPAQDSNSTQNNSAVIGGETTPDNNHQNTNNGTPQNPVTDGMDHIGNGIDNAMDDITGTTDSSDVGVPFDQMLDNGQVDHGTLAKDGMAQR